MNTQEDQRALCTRHGAAWIAAAEQPKVGIARDVREAAWPLNGLRHRHLAPRVGWCAWAGEPRTERVVLLVLGGSGRREADARRRGPFEAIQERLTVVPDLHPLRFETTGAFPSETELEALGAESGAR